MNEIMNKYKLKNKKTLNQQVYESLKEMFLDDVFEIDQKLNEASIAKLLGVSATPVREAFRRLAAEGFLIVIPYKGVYVNGLSYKELKEAYECRVVLEKLALNLAFSSFTSEEIDDLIEELNYENMDKDIDSTVNVNNKLHSYIVKKSGNLRLEKLINSLNDVLIRDKNISAGDEKRKNEILKEHLKILNAIKDKDLKLAEKCLEDHIINGYKYTSSKLKNKKKS